MILAKHRTQIRLRELIITDEATAGLKPTLVRVAILELRVQAFIVVSAEAMGGLEDVSEFCRRILRRNHTKQVACIVFVSKSVLFPWQSLVLWMSA